MKPAEDNAPSDVLTYATQPAIARWRTHLALAIAFFGGLLAGYACSFAGFGFFPMWLFFTIISPVVVCTVTVSHHLWAATLSALAMNGFLLFRVYFPGDGAFAWRLRPDEQRTVFLVTLVLAVVSLLIAGGIAAAFEGKRRETTDRSR